MSQRVKVRRLTDDEGRQLQRLVRRGGGKSQVNVVRYRRAMVVLASAGGNTVEVIARLVQTSPDRVREMIHRFNDKGMKSLDPQWAGGRPRRITTDVERLVKGGLRGACGAPLRRAEPEVRGVAASWAGVGAPGVKVERPQRSEDERP